MPFFDPSTTEDAVGAQLGAGLGLSGGFAPTVSPVVARGYLLSFAFAAIVWSIFLLEML